MQSRDTKPFGEAAQNLWAVGLPAMPLRGKRPVQSGWTEYCRAVPAEGVKQTWLREHSASNIGLPLGPLSGLCAVDIDTQDPAVIAALKAVLPQSPWERVGKKGCALIYRNGQGMKSFSLSGIVDFLADGKQVALPPSIHPETKQPYVANADLAVIYSEGRIPEIPLDLKARLHGATAGPADEGGRHTTLTGHIARWRNAGLEGDDLATAARIWNENRTGGNPLPADEVTSLCDWGDAISGASNMDKGPVTRAAIAKALTDWGVTLCYNEMKARTEIAGLPNFGLALCDAAVNRLRMNFEKERGKRCSKEYFFDALVDIGQDRRFHAVRDYLACTQRQWDRKARLDSWLIDYGGVEDTPYHRAVGVITLIAAVRRVRKPGCKFDTMTVLEGAQGCGKSTALAVLAGQSDWFTDSFPFGSGSKVIVEECGGRWIVEAGELAGLRKSDHETLKATLSRTVDIARPAYGRFSVETPRGWIVIGTTNSAEWLSDPTGNRRFLPVRVKAFDLEAMKGDRDQLWAEAASREAEGESIVLPSELWDEASRQQETRRLPSPLADELETLLGDACGSVSTRVLWEALAIPLDRRGALGGQLASAMQSLGFQRCKKRFGGNGSERGYQRGEGGIIRPSRFGITLIEEQEEKAE